MWFLWIVIGIVIGAVAASFYYRKVKNVVIEGKN